MVLSLLIFPYKCNFVKNNGKIFASPPWPCLCQKSGPDHGHWLLTLYIISKAIRKKVNSSKFIFAWKHNLNPYLNQFLLADNCRMNSNYCHRRMWGSTEFIIFETVLQWKPPLLSLSNNSQHFWFHGPLWTRVWTYSRKKCRLVSQHHDVTSAYNNDRFTLVKL